jgi:ribosomal protein S11
MRYPAIEFVALHGRKLAVAVGALAALLAALHVTLSGFGPIAPVIAGVAAGAAGWALARVGAEIVELIAETLMPH